jgi:tetratricopeptide (TPR) repeat protein
LDWSTDKIDRAIEQLQAVTLVKEDVDSTSGEVSYHALPITLTFGRNKLAQMGELEKDCRARYQRDIQSLQLVAQETDRYQSTFHSYSARTENQKRAIILSIRAESQETADTEAADNYYRQAIDLEPRSIYALTKYGRFLVNLGRIGEGLELLRKSTRFADRSTAFFAHYNLGLAYDQTRNYQECKQSLEEAIRAKPNHTHARHLYGVILSKIGERNEAIKVFDELINEEKSRIGGPTNTLVYAYKAKIISLQKEHRNSEAQSLLEFAIEDIRKYEKTRVLVSHLEELY